MSVFEIKGTPCVHILAAGFMVFKPCAPGVCMHIQNLYIGMCT